MRKAPEVPWDGRCPGCFLLPDFCVCGTIPQLDTPGLRVWIVRHVREHRKSTNSARLAYRALSNCELLHYGDRERPFDPASLPANAYLLFPEQLDHSGNPDPTGPPTYDLSAASTPTPCRDLIVLDGTWSQARRMSHRIEAVARLPRLCFSQAPARERLRRPPHPGTMATLEAIAHAMWYLHGEATSLGLLQLFDNFVEAYQRQCNKPPKTSRSKPISEPSETP